MEAKKRRQQSNSSKQSEQKQQSRAIDKTRSICRRVPDPSARVPNPRLDNVTPDPILQMQHPQRRARLASAESKGAQPSEQGASSSDSQNNTAISSTVVLQSPGIRRNKGAGSSNSKVSPTSANETIKQKNNSHICSSLDEFSKKAAELKNDIHVALEKQSKIKHADESPEVLQLKENILRISGLKAEDRPDEAGDSSSALNGSMETTGNDPSSTTVSLSPSTTTHVEAEIGPITKDKVIDERDTNNGFSVVADLTQMKDDDKTTATPKSTIDETILEKVETVSKRDEAIHVRQAQGTRANHQSTSTMSSAKINPIIVDGNNNNNDNTIIDSFATLDAKLDEESKYIALLSSLRQHFSTDPSGAPATQILETICRKLVHMSEQNNQLSINCENYESDNQKLLLVKQKLENLCRELQKSNNSIRIESLDLIKIEQGKAKEQTAKIQSTLSGVIKLFDENQQRNMSLRQENHELQQKLKSLLDHCDNWEKSVEAALKQRDIESRLLKTELAKANLLRNEEKEKFLSEKQELLQILSMMQEQQHRIEGQEAKLRSDLSNYASKYDECQAVISKGMSKFQIESKRMLQQIEKSKQDYKSLLSKYETCTRRMTLLLEEKKSWDRSINVANKKIETLEKLCRALRERKQQHDGGNDTDKPNISSNKSSSSTTLAVKCKGSNATTSATDTNAPTETSSAIIPTTTTTSETIVTDSLSPVTSNDISDKEVEHKSSDGLSDPHLHDARLEENNQTNNNDCPLNKKDCELDTASAADDGDNTATINKEQGGDIKTNATTTTAINEVLILSCNEIEAQCQNDNHVNPIDGHKQKVALESSGSQQAVAIDTKQAANNNDNDNGSDTTKSEDLTKLMPVESCDVKA